MNEQDLNSIIEANDFINELSDEVLDREAPVQGFGCGGPTYCIRLA
jgi:hypothetical protein